LVLIGHSILAIIFPYIVLVPFHCGGTSEDEAMSSSEEIKPVALSIVELCLAEGISQLVS